MGSFSNSVILKHQLYDAKLYEVVRGFTYTNEKYNITVKKGWVTDGASIPPGLAWIGCPFSGRYVESAILHDLLYRSESFSRKECDNIFLEAMKIHRVYEWKRKLIYWSVRCAGGIVWKQHQTDIVELYKKMIIIEKIKEHK